MDKEKHRTGSMPSEQTPLIQRVPIAERRARYPHRTLRRFCTIVLTCVPLAVLIAVLFLLLTGSSIPFAGDDGPDWSQKGLANDADPAPSPHAWWPESRGIQYKELKHILQTTPDHDKARQWSHYYSAGPHLAGKNLSQAEWTRDRWLDFGIDRAEITEYDVFLNYPVDHALSLLKDGEVVYQATLEEDVLAEDPTTGLEDRIPTFHGYSASGNVTASYVFANYGTYADYQNLLDAGISLEGKIALVKYGGVFRGLKVKRASDLGMIGVIMYSDPGDDGNITEENGYGTYPDGPARNPSSVQRGSCQYLSFAAGDPTTIGYPSKPGVPRQSVEGKIPDIPSLPISYKEALPLLRALNGHGPNASSFPASWHKGGLAYKGVEYNIGPSPESLQVNLYNLQDYVTTPLWNAIGIINGTLADEVVVVGNHRDAWIAGGAVDPNSGSAALNEVVRSFGAALHQGWRPQRTIVFASWDGEEYGLIGSTEWVEEYLPWLSDSAVAYINVDVATGGPRFSTSAAPLLNKIIYQVTGEVQSPNQTIANQTVRDLWNGEIETMGSGSDFTAFQDFAGIPSLDMGFGGGRDDPVYHYHSNYDSFHWVDTLGDPGFGYHIAIAKLAGLLAARLAEEPIVPFNATDYALGLRKYLKSVKATSVELAAGSDSHEGLFAPISAAIDTFEETAAAFDAHAASLAAQLADPGVASADKLALYSSVRAVNQLYRRLEREFLHAPGLDGRSWFKHVVFAPGLWTGYAGATFPGLVEALTDHDDAAATRWAHVIHARIHSASELLRGIKG